MLVLQVEKRWKEQPGPQHAESCTPGNRRRMAAEAPVFIQHPSTVFLQDQPGQQRRERQLEQSFQRTTTNKIRSQACDTQFTHG